MTAVASRRGWVGLGLALSALSLTACGGSPGRPSSTPSSPSSTTPESDPVDAQALAADLANGLDEGTTAQLSLVLDGGLVRLSLSGVVDYSADPVAMAGVMRLRTWRDERGEWGEQKVDTRVVDGVAYLGRGGKFAAYDLTEPGALPDDLVGFVGLLDPLALLDDLDESIRSAESTDTMEVAREQLERFELQVDPQDVSTLRGVPGSDALPDEISYAVWVDEEFRVRELSTFLDMGGDKVDVRVRMLAWGEPVTIEKPPAATIVEPPAVPI